MASGYGTDPEGNIVCYDCCAEIDKETMDEEGYFYLYLVYVVEKDCYYVCNWPGTLKYKVDSYKEGKHNITGHRLDFWFKDYKGKKWWGVIYGHNTQVARCQRLKD